MSEEVKAPKKEKIPRQKMPEQPANVRAPQFRGSAPRATPPNWP